MSHFSTIQTKIKHKSQLIEALELLQYDVQEDQELINPIDHQHEKVKVDVSIGNDIGFRLNQEGVYELVRIANALERIADFYEKGLHVDIDHAHIDDIGEIHGDVVTHPKQF